MTTVNITIDNATIHISGEVQERRNVSPFEFLGAIMGKCESETETDAAQAEPAVNGAPVHVELDEVADKIEEFLGDGRFAMRTYPAIKKGIPDFADVVLQDGIQLCRERGTVETRTRRIDGARLYMLAE